MNLEQHIRCATNCGDSSRCRRPTATRPVSFARSAAHGIFFRATRSTIPFSTRLHSDIGAQQTLDEFFRLCDTGTCAFGPGSAARFAALGARLKADPSILNYSQLIGMTLSAMYDSSSWEEFAGLLADLDAATAPTASLRARIGAFQARPLYIAKRGFPRYPNFLESFPAVACADRASIARCPARSLSRAI